MHVPIKATQKCSHIRTTMSDLPKYLLFLLRKNFPPSQTMRLGIIDKCKISTLSNH